MQFILRFTTFKLAILLRNIKNRTSKAHIIKYAINPKFLFLSQEYFYSALLLFLKLQYRLYRKMI